MQNLTPASWQSEERAPRQETPLPEEVEAQLQKILTSPTFRSAPRHSSFLTFVVRKALTGETVKEYSIALEVFGRKSDFDPGSDPVVRSEARRLRSRLSSYYESIGRSDSIYISLPKGTYVPTFHRLNGRAVDENASPDSSNAPDALALEQSTGPERSIPDRANLLRVLAWAVPLVLAVGLVLGYGVRHYRKNLKTTSPESSGPVLKGRRSVAVVGFANLSEQPQNAWLSTALAEMMTTELATGGRLLTIPDENVAHTKTNLKLTDRNGFSSETLQKIRQHLNADVVVSGAYAVLPPSVAPGQPYSGDNQVRLDLRVQNALTGETLATVSETGRQSSLFELITQAGQQIRHDLGIQALASPEVEQVRLSVSSNQEAVRLYAEGLDKLRRFDALGARGLLEQAVKADTQYAMAHSALAEAWLLLGYDARAEQEAKLAYELSRHLALEQKLLIEGRYYETAHQWKEAIGAYSTLFSSYPDNVEYGLRLARAQQQAAQYQDALTTVEALKKLPQPVADDPRIALAEAAAYSGLGDANRFSAAVRSAEEKATQRGEFMEVVQAQLLYGDTRFVGNDREAKLRSALQTCKNLGNLDCVARAHWSIGFLHHGEPMSGPLYQQALEEFKQVGDMRGISDVQRALANLNWTTGNLDKAARYYAETLSTCEKIQDRACIWKQTLNQGNMAYTLGYLAQAETKYREALAIARETGDGGVGLCMSNLGSTLWLEGKLDEALSFFKQVVDVTRPRGNQFFGWGLANTGGVQLDQGKLAEARQSLQEAKASQTEEFPPVADSLKSLATLDIIEGKPAGAERALKAAGEYWETHQSKEEAASYYDYIALALLAQNKPLEAQKAAEHARSLMTSEQTGLAPLHLKITEALVRAAVQPHDSQAAAKSINSLHEVIAQCRKGGFVGLELQARLAEGQIELSSGEVAKGRVQLASLETDAQRKGFGLISRQASETRRLAH